jgi:fructose-1,6-bisphosphatase I
LIGNAESDAKEIVIEEGKDYVAIFDALDGSSNVDSGIPTGTIIGVRRRWDSEEECYQ